ncbi:MAG: hypothetical protein Q8Q81_16465 [Oxalobacteraceae bacterium]|nr:hypothetical protein [Oxalobacteraceae bacterium]
MNTEEQTFSPLRVTPPTETESKPAHAELLAAEDVLTTSALLSAFTSESHRKKHDA